MYWKEQFSLLLERCGCDCLQIYAHATITDKQGWPKYLYFERDGLISYLLLFLLLQENCFSNIFALLKSIVECMCLCFRFFSFIFRSILSPLLLSTATDNKIKTRKKTTSIFAYFKPVWMINVNNKTQQQQNENTQFSNADDFVWHFLLLLFQDKKAIGSSLLLLPLPLPLSLFQQRPFNLQFIVINGI